MTDEETAEIKQEIQSHETQRDAAWRTYHYHDGMVFRLRLKLNALSPEECHGIAKLIGSKLPPREGYVEEIQPGTRGYGDYKYRVIGRRGCPVHHTDSKKDAEAYLEKCRASWLKNYKEVQQ